MLSDDEITELQFAIEADDAAEVQQRLGGLSASELTELQLYGNHTVLMYALERSTPEVAGAILAHGVKTFELPWSDNNELKSALRNPSHAPAMVSLVLDMLPKDLSFEMITGDWDPDDEPEGQAQSAFQMAQKMKDPTCKDLLLAALDGLKQS